MDGRRKDRDSGAVLLLVLVVAIVLSLVVLALANFVAADLRYSRVVNARADTLSTAESGIDYAVARLRSKQTLCATDVATSGPIGLNGTAAPTPLPGPLNDTSTTVTCEQISAGFPAVAGWSVIVTNGSQPDAIKVAVDKDRQIVGPVYVSDPSNIDVYNVSKLFSTGGDIWHKDATCATPLPPSALSSRLFLQEPAARGPICTTAVWSDIVSAPQLPNLAALPPGDLDGELSGSCLVFPPGHYTSAPQIPDVDWPNETHAYFQSGDYWFDQNVDEWLIDWDAVVSAGHPGSAPAPPGDAECDAARAADPNAGGTGATFYLGDDSRLRLDDGASLYMFERQQGDFFVNIQALPTSNPGIDRSLVRTRPGSSVHLVVRGLVWSPNSRIALDNPHNFSVQQLLGGVVTYQLWIGDTATGGPTSADVVEPASAAIDAVVRLRSTSTLNGVSTTVEAIVQYRPQTDDVDQRVAVNSSRVVS